MTGLLGYGACYWALHEADLVLMLGTDFPYDDFLPTAATTSRSTSTRPGWAGAPRWPRASPPTSG